MAYDPLAVALYLFFQPGSAAENLACADWQYVLMAVLG